MILRVHTMGHGLLVFFNGNHVGKYKSFQPAFQPVLFDQITRDLLHNNMYYCDFLFVNTNCVCICCMQDPVTVQMENKILC